MVGGFWRLYALALGERSAIRIGHEFEVAANQQNFDYSYLRAMEYATCHRCSVWVLDVRTCEHSPKQFEEPLRLPEPTSSMGAVRQTCCCFYELGNPAVSSDVQTAVHVSCAYCHTYS